MARELIILRHAKSAWDTDALTDFDRPLAKRGLKAAPRMGRFLKKQKVRPSYVVSSPARRAKQTVTLACKEMKFSKKNINWDERIYGAGTSDLLGVLAEIPAKQKMVMIVGHNPGLEFLYNHLVAEAALNDGFGGMVKTATSVRLSMPDDWTDLPEGCADLLMIQHPRHLPDTI